MTLRNGKVQDKKFKSSLNKDQNSFKTFSRK